MVVELHDDPAVGARDLAAGFAAGHAHALGDVGRLLLQGREMSPREKTGLEEARGIAEMVKVEEAQRLIARFVSR
jgi:enoyl-CoA hydratase/carnithine racemase